MHINKIIDYIKNEINFSQEFCEDNVFVTLRTDAILKIIENLELSHKYILEITKENEEKDKQIDLMAEYMEENMDEYQLDEIYAKQYNCNGMERNWTRGKEKEIKDIKQYFEKLAKEKGE